MVHETLAASSTWDPETLDDLLDKLQDSTSPAEDLAAWIEPIVQSEAVRMICEVFQFIDGAPNRLLALDQVRWQLGVPNKIDETISCAVIARRYGVSKQAVVQGAERLTAALGLRKSSHERSEEAKVKFASTHYRKRRKEGLLG